MHIAKGISYTFDQGRGRWRIYFNLRGCRWTEEHPTEQLTKTYAEAYARRVANGDDIRPIDKRDAGPMAPAGTVRAVYPEWLADIAATGGGVVSTSATFYAIQFEQHILPALGDEDVAGLTRGRCKEFVRALTKKKKHGGGRLAAGTRTAICAALSAFLSWCRDNPEARPYLTGLNPMYKLTKFAHDQHEVTEPHLAWTAAEVDRLLAACLRDEPFWYPLLFVALRTGLRKGEIVELRRDKDFRTADHLLVQRQYVDQVPQTYTAHGRRLVAEKDFDASRVRVPKGKQLRKVWLDPEVQTVLAKHDASERARALRSGLKLPSLVFVGPRFGRVSIGHFVQRVLKPLCERAGVPTTSSFHTTRHTYASVLLMAGEDLEWVSRQLGHKDISTTETVYRHVLDDSRRDTERVARIAKAWTVAQAKPRAVAGREDA